jgi:2-polyprenyl-3-methyl-5-hydroxy-6-metoxy-1,4-benzoquinol methylase
MASVTRDEARGYYEDFSLAVGIRDWLQPNPRHQQLRLLVDELLHARRGLRILDVGCGAGVMTDHLRRYGEVIGIDFSSAAVAAARTYTARRFGRAPTFYACSLQELPVNHDFEFIALFDVLEHIPENDRWALLAQLQERLAPEGLLFVSTPHPASTARRRLIRDDTLQIIDEEVELPRVTQEAAAVGLQLIRFAAYDVFTGSPEYQMMIFTRERLPGGPVSLRVGRFTRRSRLRQNRIGMQVCRTAHSVRLLVAGDRQAARRMLVGSIPDVRS